METKEEEINRKERELEAAKAEQKKIEQQIQDVINEIRTLRKKRFEIHKKMAELEFQTTTLDKVLNFLSFWKR